MHIIKNNDQLSLMLGSPKLPVYTFVKVESLLEDPFSGHKFDFYKQLEEIEKKHVLAATVSISSWYQGSPFRSERPKFR